MDYYKNYSNRFASFEEWPHESVSPQRMARAGFFFSGEDSSVLCPYCNLKLSRWNKEDNPFERHSKFTNGCEYVARYIEPSWALIKTLGLTLRSDGSYEAEQLIVLEGNGSMNVYSLKAETSKNNYEELSFVDQKMREISQQCFYIYTYGRDSASYLEQLLKVPITNIMGIEFPLLNTMY